MLQDTVVKMPDGAQGRVLSSFEGTCEVVVIEPSIRRGLKVTAEEDSLEVLLTASQLWAEEMDLSTVDTKNLSKMFDTERKKKSEPRRKGFRTLGQQFAEALRAGNKEEQERILVLMAKEKENG